MLEPEQPKSLQWFVDAIHRFENFLSLCLGSSVRAKTVRLIGQSEENESGWLIRPRGGRAEKPYVPIWVRCDSSQLATAIASWFSTPEEFTPLENLIYGTIRHSSLFVETEFLSLAQALESFHRLTDKSTVVEPRLFGQVLKTLCRFISQTWGDSPIAERCLDGIRFANEPTFQTRVQSLFARIDYGRERPLTDEEWDTFRRALLELLLEARELACRDHNTGAFNEPKFREVLRDEIKRSHRFRRPLTVAYLDLDGFKKVNDTRGHNAGDKILKVVAETMQSTVREMDSVSHLHGDEFALLFPETNGENARVVGDRGSGAVCHSQIANVSIMVSSASTAKIFKQLQNRMFSNSGHATRGIDRIALHEGCYYACLAFGLQAIHRITLLYNKICFTPAER